MKKNSLIQFGMLFNVTETIVYLKILTNKLQLTKNLLWFTTSECALVI